MSRIGDVVAMVSQDDFKFTEDFIKKIAIKVSKSQYDNGAFVKLTAPFSFYEDVLCEGKKNKQSLENINLVYSVKYKNNKFIFESGLEFNNITACPCVQQTFKHALLESGIKKNEFNKLVPFLTHSQRCRTKVLIKGYRDYLNILEVLKIIDKSTLRVQNTLPRDHELNIVHKAHKNPQFTEDIVRGVAFNIYKKLNDKNPQASVSVEIDSMESIHDFNIQAKVDYSFKDLKKYESAL